MAIKYSLQTFPTGFASKCLCSDGGKHIYHITLSEDTPNGVFIGKGAFIELDNYAEAAAGSVTGNIVGKAPNGNYYVDITACDEGTLFVNQVPLIEEEWTNSFQKEENFYNPSGTAVRASQLAYGDTIELNAAALGLTQDPTSYPVAVTATAYGTSTMAKQLA